MARLRIGGPVPGRKVMPNPQTCSGFPRWNTYQGLGQISVARELRIQASEAGVRCGTVARHQHKLHKDNIAHRIKRLDQRDSARRGHFNKARVLSIKIDREENEPALDAMLKEYNEHVMEIKGTEWYRKLVRLEGARGITRAIRV